MSSYSLYSAYPAPVAEPTGHSAFKSSSSLASALDDPHWSTPRIAPGTSFNIPQPSLPTRTSSSSYVPPPLSATSFSLASSYSIPHASSPDSTSSLSNSEYAYESPVDTLRAEYDVPHAAGSLAPAFSTGGIVTTADGYYDAAPAVYFASDSPVSAHALDAGTTIRPPPSKRITQVPDVARYGLTGPALSGYLPSPSSSGGGGGGLRARRTASSNNLMPISQGALHSYNSSPIESVKVESPTLSAIAFAGYNHYESYLDIQMGSIGSQTQHAVPQHVYTGTLPISPVSPVHPPTAPYYDAAYATATQHYGSTPESPLYAQPQVLDPRSAAFGGEVAVLGPLDGVHSPYGASNPSSPHGTSDNEASIDVPLLLPAMVPSYGSDDGQSEPEYESDDYVYEEDDGSEYDDSSAGRRRAMRRTARKARRSAGPVASTSTTTMPVMTSFTVNGGIGEDFYAPVDHRSRATRPSTSALPLPVPVPNLTKKSRGRRVPTATSLAAKSGIGKTSRSYWCKIDGCGKCFARGEHLKRHVRSIHTNEKPHKCPHPGCEKAFSRHDNLGQHMRIHKDQPAKRR